MSYMIGDVDITEDREDAEEDDGVFRIHGVIT